MPRGLTDDLNPSQYCILALHIFVKFTSGFARHIIESDLCGFQNIHEIGLVTRHGSPAPSQGSVFA